MSNNKVDVVDSGDHTKSPRFLSNANRTDIASTQPKPEDVDPGSTILWFGKFRGQRFDQLPEWYSSWALKTEVSDPSDNVREPIAQLKRST